MEDDSDSQSVLEALVPGAEDAVGDGKRWKGEAEGDLTPGAEDAVGDAKPWKGEAEGDLTPGEEGAVGDGEPWKGKAKGDLPIREEGKSSSPMSRSSRLSSSNIGTFSLKYQFFLPCGKAARCMYKKQKAV